MEKVISRDVIVIGGDHNNTLAVLRCLAKNNCRVTLVIHSKDIKKNAILKSKYVKKYEILKDFDEEIITFLRKYEVKNKKTILFPCSDVAAYTIDYYGDELSNKYLIFGFKNNYGKVCKMMDKYEQYLWANQHGVPIAKTWKMEFENFSKIQISDILFPCILKPEISAFGKKSDICIINTQYEFADRLEDFRMKGYKSVIIQEFIKKEYEICAFGCIDNTNFHYGIIKKEREYPVEGGGSLTYAKFIKNDKIKKAVENILFLLKEEEFIGNFDIEFFICGSQILLNEINFRHSGNGVALVKAGIPAPFISCLSLWHKKVSDYKYFVDDEIYYMNELSELFHVKNRYISIYEYLKSIYRAHAFTYFDRQDLSGTFGFYRLKLEMIIKKILRMKNEKN